jgi:predicted  nucleic acid-binding Zn-ribbon protein
VSTSEDLIIQINQVFRRQHSINQMQHNLASANFFANIFNFARTFGLQSIIAKGQKQILKLNQSISTLEMQIQSLNQNIESQRAEAKVLSKTLMETRLVLKRAIIQYRRELDQQKQQIRAQGWLY